MFYFLYPQDTRLVYFVTTLKMQSYIRRRLTTQHSSLCLPCGQLRGASPPRPNYRQKVMACDHFPTIFLIAQVWY
jgi:hypothetical protein